MGALRDEMDDVFRRFWPDMEWDGNGGLAQLSAPALDISETESQIEVKMDVPGMKPEELNIEVTGDLLRISGEHKEEKEEKNRQYHRVERRSGSFERSVRMPCAVKDKEVDAQYRDGVLTVTLAKTEEAKTHKIPVKG